MITEQAKKAGMQEAPRLPQSDVASPDFLSSKLGLLEKLLQEAAIAMDDDFNSRQALAKVSNGARLIPQILNSEEIDERDTAAFAMYAIDWLEEFAGRVLGLLPSKRSPWPFTIKPRPCTSSNQGPSRTIVGSACNRACCQGLG